MALLKEEAFPNDRLPEEILEFIFQKIEYLESLLNSRLICKYWKSTFDNSTIMKQLTFVVNDWRLLNGSTIVEKVKSINFTTPFLVSEEESKNEWLQFCNKIGSTVHKIVFDIDYDANDSEHIQLINSLVSSCSGLKELHINQQILECLQEPEYENIQIMVLMLLDKQDGALEFALTHFPNLVKIDVHHLWVPSTMRILLEYAKSSKGFLKEIIIREPVCDDREYVNIFNIKEQLEFLHTCDNLGIKISNNFLPSHLDAATLFAHEETNEAPVNEVTCQSFNSAQFYFDGINPLATDRIGYCKNIHGLFIRFCRPAWPCELQFLPKLQKIEWMHIIIGREFLINTTIVNQVNFVGAVVQFRFPTLVHLMITGDVFGQAISEVLPSFSDCFPNLKRLTLNFLKVIPNDIFVQLSKLGTLEQIDITGYTDRIDGCPWTDDKFIVPCESQQQNPGDVPVFVPAIAAFKNLARLTIEDCSNVTDLFVVQGIALSKTLSELKIVNCIRITEARIAELQQGSSISYIWLP